MKLMIFFFFLCKREGSPVIKPSVLNVEILILEADVLKDKHIFKQRNASY